MERVGRAIRQLPDCKGSSERTRAVSEFQFRNPMTPASIAISSASFAARHALLQASVIPIQAIGLWAGQLLR
jgi:hypothetical protein